MSKDLQNRLQWLEDELWEDDLPEDEQSFDLDDIVSEFSQEEESTSPSRNRAVEFDRMAFGDEDFDESTAVLVARKKGKSPGGAPKKKGIKGLVILATVEVIAIIAVLLRWALWFL